MCAFFSVPAFKHLSAEILSEIADALEEVRVVYCAYFIVIN